MKTLIWLQGGYWCSGSRSALRGILAVVLALAGTQVSSASYVYVEPSAATLLETATQIAAGRYHTCALTSDGVVKCWGLNQYGQLGDGTKISRSTPVAVVGLSDVSVIAAGEHHTCVRMNNGGMKCWGKNEYGQLGDGSNITRTTPVDVDGLSSGVDKIATGDSHTCAITTGGAAKCWGYNYYGHVGDGSQIDRLLPTDVSGLSSGVTDIVGGGTHTCALVAGGVKCWGSNGYGHLGDGTTTTRWTPTDVIGLNSSVATLVGGGTHNCAITTSGGLKCWGRNDLGQLGDGSTINRFTPVSVSGLGSGVSLAAAGDFHTCAKVTTTVTQVRCWGSNGNGQLGNGTTIDKIVPLAVAGLDGSVTGLVAGRSHTCALTAGSLSVLEGVTCWGSNSNGQLGNGAIASALAPSEATGVVGLGTAVSAVAAGTSFACVLSVAGAVKCWGHNGSGELGDGTTVNRKTVTDVSGLSSGMREITLGGYHTCALTMGGIAKCWGQNDKGQLGDATTSNKLIPTDVTGLSGSVNVIKAGDFHTCAVDSGVKCWGSNFYGQLGDGTYDNKLTPTEVSGLSSGVQALAAGYGHTCALLNNDGLKCWGRNDFGQLGDSTFLTRTSPVDVAGLSSGVYKIAAGFGHTCALMSSGAVKCWGKNEFGQLGDDTLVNRSSPVDVIGLSSGVSAITASGDHTCALKTSGKVQCWGRNFNGQLGDTTMTDRDTPTDVVMSGLIMSEIEAGDFHTCARTTDAKAMCWGYNVDGQLGNEAAWRTTPHGVVGFSTPPPVDTGDAYEHDDSCGDATFLSANIATQDRSFDATGDADWIRIEMVTGTNYTLVANNLVNGALPNFLVHDSCIAAPSSTSPSSFGGEVRLPMNASDYAPGAYFVRVSDTLPTTAGVVSYTLSFRATSSVGAAIIVAGRNGGEIHQNVITQTTDMAYRVLLRNGFPKDRIYYLDNQTIRDVDGDGIANDIAGPATVAGVQYAITTWARGKVGTAQPLWLYMADHGNAEEFLVSGDGAGNVITPAMLDSWLTQIETFSGVDQVNVIMDACHAGSFITAPGSISKAGRAILASVSADKVAQGRRSGPGIIQRMYFGEALWSGLDANLSLRDAFEQARLAAARATGQNQQAWLDDNGDGFANGVNNGVLDGEASTVRGLIGSVDTGGRPYLVWQLADANTGALVVDAQAAGGASNVTVEIARPDTSQTFVPGQVNLAQHDMVFLTHTGNGRWIGSYNRFDTPGVYRLLVYGFDADDSPAQPVAMTVTVQGPATMTPTVTPLMTVTPTVTPTTSTPTPSITQTPMPTTTTTIPPTLTPTLVLRSRIFVPVLRK